MDSKHRFSLSTELSRIMGVSIAYFAIGKLSLLLSIPPGYSAPVWPAAGIALGSILVFGYRAWVGIWIGSFCVNVATSFDAITVAAVIKSTALPAAIGIGASLQAVAGAYLIKRFVAFPLSHDRPTDIFIMLVLGGPICCMINATTGVLSLLISGAVHGKAFIQNWQIWYAGDTIGVLVVLPLVSIWKMQLAHSPRHKKLSVISAIAVVVAVTLALFVDVRNGEWERTQLTFQQRVMPMARALKSNIESKFEVLDSIRSLFGASQLVERQEFKAFVRNFLNRHSDIQALEWIPKVRDTERDLYAENARKDGYPGFMITELNNMGRLVKASVRPEYFPVYYVEPYPGNEKAFGFDLASTPQRLNALNRARDNGKKTASSRITLVQETKHQYGILIFLPIYIKGKSIDSVESRRKNLEGFSLGVFRVSQMLSRAMAPFKMEGLSYRLYDNSAPNDERLLFALKADGHPDTSEFPKESESKLHWNTTFDVAGRTWSIIFHATQTYFASQRLWEAYAVLTGGLIFTSLFGSCLLLIVGRVEVTEQTVLDRTSQLAETNASLENEIKHRMTIEEELRNAGDELEGRVTLRTAELEHANRRLQEEMAERKQVQRKISKSETKFRKLVESAPDVILILNHQGNISLANKRTQDIFGYAPEELIGHPHDVLLPERFRQKHAKHRSGYFSNPHIRPMGGGMEDLIGRRKDGNEFPVEISLSPLKNEDGLEVISTVRDITIRKNTEQELRKHRDNLEVLVGERTKALEAAMEDVKKADTLKSAFLASMSHEIRTPLNSIIGFTGILLQEIVGPVNDEQKKQLSMVQNSSEHLLSLINDILDLSKIEAGQLTIDETPFDFKESLKMVINAITPLAEKKGIVLIAEDFPLAQRMLGDRRRVEQILINLINNAIKFTERGSVKISFSVNQAMLSTAVADTGIGIAPDDLQHVFDTFRQIETTLSRKYEGTGLGLAICKSLIKMMGGNISAQSRGLGKGSIFTFTLPVAD